MEREPVRSGPPGDELVGWVGGEGPEVLLLHGGPGLSYGYLDSLVEELGSGYRMASYQQRGLAPSTTGGPFTVDKAVDDAVTFLDALGWEKAYVVGHSWGGHLLLHLATRTPERLLGGLAVDPLGGVGDGGRASFDKEMAGRTSGRVATGGGGADEAFRETLRILWPAYFAAPENAPEMPGIATSFASYSGLSESLGKELPGLTAGLCGIRVPFGFVAGARSPLPAEEASGATAALLPGSFLDLVEGAGHFPWIEKPGRVGAALDRLVQASADL